VVPVSGGSARRASSFGFEDAAGLLKALGHPLRLRLLCGLCREPSTLSRIGADLATPLSTLALHLGVLRRAGLLSEERRGAEVVFHVTDERTRGILHSLCAGGTQAADTPPPAWAWSRLGRERLSGGERKRSGGSGR